MKKLFTAFIFTLIFTPYTFGIDIDIEEIIVPEHFPYELKKFILLDLAKNVHNYVGAASYENSSIDKARRIISQTSRINWDLYKELDKERNDPITTRTMIKNLIVTCYQNSFCEGWPELGTIHLLKSPGAKKCIQLSNQLYDKNLTPEKIEQLFNDGAILNYSNQQERKTILSYWASSNSNTSIGIMKTLLHLGANQDMYDDRQGSPLRHAIWNGNIEKIKILLSYKATKEWYTVLLQGNHRFIDILIASSTNDELNNGLISCINNDPYLPEIMQKFIDHGANPSLALADILKRTIEQIDCLTPDHILIQKFNFLCDQQAHDSTTLSKVQNIQTIFGSLANKLVHNQPSEK